MANQAQLTSELALKMARVVEAIEEGIKLQVIRIEGNNVFLVRHLMPKDEKSRQLYVKNLFLYTRLKMVTKEWEALYVKDIESNQLIAFYKNEKVICL